MYVCMYVCVHVCTRWDGQMSRASVSHAGRSGNLNITDSSLDPVGSSLDPVGSILDPAGSSPAPAGSNPGQVKPMTLKLILVTS